MDTYIQKFNTHWEKTFPQYGSSEWNEIPDFLYSIEVPIAVENISFSESLSQSLQNLHKPHQGLWVPAQKMHITLALPGRMGFHFQLNEERSIRKKLTDIVSRYKPFEVLLGNINCFPNSLFREVYDKDGFLAQLHQDICSEIPFSQDPAYQFQNFIPHISLYYGQGDSDLFRHSKFTRELPIHTMNINRLFLAKTKNKDGEYEKQILSEFLFS